MTPRPTAGAALVREHVVVQRAAAGPQLDGHRLDRLHLHRPRPPRPHSAPSRLLAAFWREGSCPQRRGAQNGGLLEREGGGGPPDAA
jgi:hypothetical protein